MLRFMTRALGLLLLAGAFAALVADGVRSIAGEAWSVTPLGAAAIWLFPKSFPILQPAVERHLHPWLWDPVLLNLFLAPAFVVLGLLGVLLFAIGLRRRERRKAP